MSEFEAFALGTGLAVIAYSEDSPQKHMIQIMNMGQGMCICGEESLRRLKQAIDFALGEERKAE